VDHGGPPRTLRERILGAGPRCYEDDNDAPGRHDWWNNIDVISLDDLEALDHFLDNCDHLLEASDSEVESGASIPWYLGR
jgi:hypothetical protein